MVLQFIGLSILQNGLMEIKLSLPEACLSPIILKNPLLVYNHGTRIKKGAPKKLSGENILAMMFSTDGYYVISPDFIGLG